MIFTKYTQKIFERTEPKKTLFKDNLLTLGLFIIKNFWFH